MIMLLRRSVLEGEEGWGLVVGGEKRACSGERRRSVDW